MVARDHGIPMVSLTAVNNRGKSPEKYCIPSLSLFWCLYMPVAPVAQRYHVTSDTLGREFDPGKRDFSY